MKYLLPIILTFFYLNTFSQILWTQKKIFDLKNNADYTKEYLKKEDGSTDYDRWKIIFTEEEETKASGKYTQLETYYLTKLKDGDIRCYQFMYEEPLSEANGWISYYNKQGWVKTEGKMEWIDYGGKRKRNIYIDETCRVYVRFFKP